MGQDTYIDNGVSVSLSFCVENFDILRNLITIVKNDEDKNLTCNITGLLNCDDEIVEFSELEGRNKDSFEYNLIYCFNKINNKEQFSTLLEEYCSFENVYINFLYKCSSAYARNISRRTTPCIFGNDTMSIEEIINLYQAGVQLFKDAGVSEDEICAGYTFCDYY